MYGAVHGIALNISRWLSTLPTIPPSLGLFGPRVTSQLLQIIEKTARYTDDIPCDLSVLLS